MFSISGYNITGQLYESTHPLVYRAHHNVKPRPVVLNMLKNAYPARKNPLVMLLEDFDGESLTRLLPD